MSNQFSKNELRILHSAIGGVISDLETYRQSWEPSTGRPLPDAARVIDQTTDALKEYVEIRLKIERLIHAIR